VDYGLTTTKAVLFNPDGTEIGSSSAKTEISNIGDFAEIEMERQWKTTAGVIRSCLQKTGTDPRLVTGVGCSGHGAGLYPLDKRGRPVRKAISSMDGRAVGIIRDWKAKGLSSYRKTYQHMWNGQPVPLLFWLKENEPDNYRVIHRICMAKDWIKFKLTGELTTDFTDASCAGLLNLEEKRYDPELFQPYQIEEVFEKLPAVSKSTDLVGAVSKTAAEETGLVAGTPVIGGLFDVVACALGSGVYDESKYSITAGTWNINSAVGNRLLPSEEIMMWSLYADGEKYICIDSSATSAVNLEWFIKNVIMGFNGLQYDYSQIYAKIEAGIRDFTAEEVDLIYLPFLYKSKLTRELDGGFVGFRASHNIYHLLRALYEGVVFGHRRHLENLRRGGIVKEQAALSGGAVNSECWCQLFADILGIEIITTKASEIGALGTAIAVSVATGEYRSLEEAVQGMVSVNKHYYPGRDSLTYQKKYERFTEIIDRLDHKPVLSE